jgi:NAD(P)-dependent dehydrogenase (short-subunit alcohol dehydrogenase family)
MAADHLTEGIRVNAVTPGTTDTPWRVLYTAEDPDAAAKMLALIGLRRRCLTTMLIAACVTLLGFLVSLRMAPEKPEDSN